MGTVLPTAGGDRDVDLGFLRVLALNEKRSTEIERLLAGLGTESRDNELVTLLGLLRVSKRTALSTLDALASRRAEMEAALGRPVPIKVVALDCLESLEGQTTPAPHGVEPTYDQLLEMAYHDQLTGLPNYRHFIQRYDEEIKRADRYRRIVSVIMADVDRFKDINDRFGHELGNRALVHVAELLSKETRDTDLVARYGGDEFAIILPETPKHQAVELAERLRGAIESAPLPFAEAEGCAISVSMGLASYPRDVGDSKALLVCADQALYASKEQGRRRVTVFEPSSAIALAYRPERPEAALTVHVAGDFNGWDKRVDAMHPQPDGTFTLSLRIAPGRYLYKYIVNSDTYLPDPLATELVDDGFGGKNAVLLVPGS